jgi:predicted HTH domain antitoxin
VKIEIEIPDALVERLQFDAQASKEMIVLELYRREKISGGEAAELLGVYLYDFPGLLDSSEVEVKGDVQELWRNVSELTGEVLNRVMQALPCRDLDLELKREQMPVREISL